MKNLRKTRIGIVGAGWFATANHIPVLAQRGDVELAAVCRLGREKLISVQQKFGFSLATEDYTELLEQDLDGVIVSSPHDKHYEHAAAALSKGLHVLCEKPMTLRASEAWNLVRMADRKSRHLLIPYGWNYKRFIGQAKEMLDSGAIGEIEYVAGSMASPTKNFFAGYESTVPTDWIPTISGPEADTWKSKFHGGGYCYGQLTHLAGLLFWLTKLRASRVACLMTSPHSNVDMYDSAVIEFTGGVTGSISGAATLPDGSPFQLQLQIFGSEGALALNAEAGRERLSLSRHDGKNREVPVSCGAGAYSCVDPVNNFVELIQGHGMNCSPGDVAARAVELTEAMHRSTQCGGVFFPIAINEAFS